MAGETNEFNQMKGTTVTLELPETMLTDQTLAKLKAKILAATIEILNTMDTNIGGSCHGKAHCKAG